VSGAVQDVVLRALMEDQDAGTPAEIAASSGLQRAEVEVALASLEQRGLVRLFKPSSPTLEPWWLVAR
jgi:DNA-binding IclR family transcriptional regulator